MGQETSFSGQISLNRNHFSQGSVGSSNSTKILATIVQAVAVLMVNVRQMRTEVFVHRKQLTLTDENTPAYDGTGPSLRAFDRSKQSFGFVERSSTIRVLYVMRVRSRNFTADADAVDIAFPFATK